MKIEKLNDNQIRCTLTREDLQQRGLKLSELAYGTEKARALFQDMMQQAQYLFGFQVENTPLMVEAVPMAGGTIVLVVTKVENPEELDTRFSSFAPSVQSDTLQGDHEPTALEQLLDAVRGAAGLKENSENGSCGKASGNAQSSMANDGRRAGLTPQDVKNYQSFLMTHRMFAFPSISAAAAAAKRAAQGFTAQSALLVEDATHTYYLFVTMKDVQETDALQPQLAALSEYGRVYLAPYARMEYIREHGRTILGEDAIAALSEL